MDDKKTILYFNVSIGLRLYEIKVILISRPKTVPNNQQLLACPPIYRNSGGLYISSFTPILPIGFERKNYDDKFAQKVPTVSIISMRLNI